MSSLLECIQLASSVAFSVTALRALPMLVAFFASESCALRQRTSALVIYLGTLYVAARHFGFEPDKLLAAYAYLCAASALLFWVRMPRPRLTVFPAALLLFVVAPAVLLPRQALLILLGWDLTLSVYSYCVDVPRAARRFDDYWFFVFVNPTIAYGWRGTRVSEPGFNARGLARVLIGIVALALSGAIAVLGAPDKLSGAGELAKPALISARVAGLYSAQWGVASLQIGLFRILGYHAPERYLNPFSARTPREFWNRWNTYLGTWVRVYVFTPLVRVMRGWRPVAMVRRVRLTGAVLLSFLFVGAMHDLYATAVTHRLSAGGTVWFGVNASVLLIWEFAPRVPVRSGAGWVSRTAMVATMVGLAFLFP